MKTARTVKKRDIPFAVDGQRYACATKMLGDCRLLAVDCRGVETTCKIRGSMRKRVYVNPGDWVLVANRGDLGGEDDVIDKLLPAEVVYLRKIGEIRDSSPADSVADDAEDVDICFEDVDAI